ncbi:hypothetical protein ILUMI_09001 [Ignelater luminosus]|uniref:Choline/carnitine acyltransferase domain-containing protein n=1 Tax=Ignelater luminosus TaxID=2038154 RepID=A0A8K0D0M7_IGNLU|nr:hypothetical protein ILUMI_09001 [Ignelater luminosus]
MLTESERYLKDKKMLRTLSLLANRSRGHQQLYQKLLYSIGSQNVVASRTAASDNPQNLPPLPVPKLNDTIEKYLKTVKPFLDEKEFINTTALFKRFSDTNGVGNKLQEYLLKKAQSTTNWFEPWWLDAAYLGFRKPVVVYSSPGQTLPLQTFKSESERLNYTTRLILAAASYKILIDSKQLPVEKMGKHELDMNQYNKIFGTCRIPDLPKDDIEFNPRSKHIVVAHNNHYFKVNLFNENGRLLSEKQLLQQLNNIIVQSTEPAVSVGILTSDDRDNWAKAYKILMQEEVNQRSVRTIQTSLFLVCLDSPMEYTTEDNRRTSAGKQLIHGGGSNANAGNRWYDKTVQFVLGTDGIVGLTYEHSPSEGGPIAVMVDYIYQFIKKDGSKDIPDGDHDQDPIKLPFKISNDLNTAIATAKTNIDKLVNNFELNCFSFDKYGKDFVKSQKFSPDSFIQIALQYAFYRMHNVPGAHYESAGTRKYLGGRTETIRSCSVESVNFAKAMLDTKINNAEKLAALKAAIQSHKQYTVDAVNGYGVDRHLLGLKLSAKEMGLSVPEIFQDPSFVRSTHMRISTSQVATKCDGFMCYGPIEDDGYGCCYNPRDNDINIAVSAFASNKDTSAKQFRTALENSLVDMETLLIKTQKAKM